MLTRMRWTRQHFQLQKKRRKASKKSPTHRRAEAKAEKNLYQEGIERHQRIEKQGKNAKANLGIVHLLQTRRNAEMMIDTVVRTGAAWDRLNQQPPIVEALNLPTIKTRPRREKEI